MLANDFVVTMAVSATGVPEFRLSLDAADSTPENILKTAVIMSLFTDRLADVDDVIPDGSNDRRGYWGDVLAPLEGDKIGSRLWLLSREKETVGVLRRAEEYAYEALEWLITDGVAKRIIINATNEKTGWLNLNIEIVQADNNTTHYSYIWEALNGV